MRTERELIKNLIKIRIEKNARFIRKDERWYNEKDIFEEINKVLDEKLIKLGIYSGVKKNEQRKNT